MEKRLNRSDLMFSLAFLLMLIIAVGAFFYGVKIGSDRTEAKYAVAEEVEPAPYESPNGYQQQDLVSFYHTVFLPYREFQAAWSDAQNKWLSDPTADRSADMKELTKIAKKKYESLRGVSVPKASPKLLESQSAYLKSLKLFEEAFGALMSTANEGTAEIVVDKVNGNSFYKEAVSQSLQAQNGYYSSMLKWAASINTEISADYTAPAILSISKWKALPLLVKIKIASDYLANQLLMTDYMPNDLAARVDQFIQSGQAEKRKVKSFNAIAELLTSTEAVRNGDFIGMKTRFYENEQLPQLPFFFADK